MTILKTARFAALLAGGSMLLAAAPGLAQPNTRRAQSQPSMQGLTPEQQAQQQVLQRRFSALSRGEKAAFMPLLQAGVAANTARAAGQAPNLAAIQALLPAAQAAAKSNEARFFLAQVQLEIAVGTNNIAAQEQALAALVGNPAITPAEQTVYRNAQATLLNKRAEQAFSANDFATAERLYRQILQSSPGDQRILTNLRIVQERQGNTAGALQGIDQEIRTAEAGGQRAPEALYQRAWQLPYRAGQRSAAFAALQNLLRAYPTAANWRQAFEMVRESTGQDNQALLDTYRFARAANLIQPREYLSLAQTLDQAGLPGETKAVIDAGVAAGAVQSNQADVVRLMSVANRRIGEDRAGLPGQIQQARSAANGKQARIAGDVLYGYGRYAEAAELYRVALGKGGEDANLLNLRVGASLAMAGQRAGAETALRAVTGTRAELASLWLTWLNRRQG
jgi:hypothetical protein